LWVLGLRYEKNRAKGPAGHRHFPAKKRFVCLGKSAVKDDDTVALALSITFWVALCGVSIKEECGAPLFSPGAHEYRL
jgi:hypothetical protein